MCIVPYVSEKMESRSEDDADNFSGSMQRTTKRMWESSCTSLMSKKVKGTHSEDQQTHSHSCNWTSDGGVSISLDRNCSSITGNKFLCVASLENSESKNKHEKAEVRISNITDKDTTKCYSIMLMNIADTDKISRLTKVRTMHVKLLKHFSQHFALTIFCKCNASLVCIDN